MWHSKIQNRFTEFYLANRCVQRIIFRVITYLQQTKCIQEIKFIAIANQFQFQVFKLSTLIDYIQKMSYKSGSFVEIKHLLFTQINLPKVLVFHARFFFLQEARPSLRRKLIIHKDGVRHINFSSSCQSLHFSRMIHSIKLGFSHLGFFVFYGVSSFISQRGT